MFEELGRWRDAVMLDMIDMMVDDWLSCQVCISECPRQESWLLTSVRREWWLKLWKLHKVRLPNFDTVRNKFERSHFNSTSSIYLIYIVWDMHQPVYWGVSVKSRNYSLKFRDYLQNPQKPSRHYLGLLPKNQGPFAKPKPKKCRI